jgi:hypothetical protein
MYEKYEYLSKDLPPMTSLFLSDGLDKSPTVMVTEKQKGYQLDE